MKYANQEGVLFGMKETKNNRKDKAVLNNIPSHEKRFFKSGHKMVTIKKGSQVVKPATP